MITPEFSPENFVFEQINKSVKSKTTGDMRGSTGPRIIHIIMESPWLVRDCP